MGVARPSRIWTDLLFLASHRLTLDLWLAKDNRFLNSKSSYGRILTAPPCRLIRLFVTFLPSGFSVSFFLWKVNKFMKRARGLATPMKGSSSRPANKKWAMSPKVWHDISQRPVCVLLTPLPPSGFQAVFMPARRLQPVNHSWIKRLVF